MQRRISEASEADLEWQSSLIRSMFEMSFPPRWPASSPEDLELKVSQRILAYATAIGEDLERIAMRHGDTVDWLTLMRFAGGGRRVHPVQWDPWSLNAAAGNALFLINLAKATGEEKFAALGHKALASALATLRTILDGPFRNLVNTSGFVGSFGLVYALAASGHDAEAVQVALQYSEEELEQFSNPDYLTGAAGPLTILTHLYRTRHDARILVRAQALARAIAKCAVDGGRAGWKVPFFARPLLGMAHGSAGIASALLLLFAETGDPQLLNAAQAGFAHERDHFQTAEQDWPNLQEPEGRISYMTGWCAGAPGIGLSRLVARTILPDDPEIVQEIEAALQATRRHLGGQQHHLCCGEAGRIVFLAQAAEALNRPELRSEALAAASRMLDAVEHQNYWCLQEFCEKLTVPGLLSGVPGIGMMLLSLVYPQSSKVAVLC
jgi:lantibiotic modifying enzyme